MEQIFTIDVSMVQIVTKTPAKTYTFKTASKVEKKPLTTEGKEIPLELKGVRVAVKKAKNSYIGSEIKMTDNAFTPDVFALINGGTVTYEEDGTTFKSYEAPVIGEEEDKKKFDFITYTESLDETGEVLGYMKETYANCEGSLTGYSQEDDKFFSPEFTVTSRPPRGSSGYKIEAVKTLPVEVFNMARGVFMATKEDGAVPVKVKETKK